MLWHVEKTAWNNVLHFSESFTTILKGIICNGKVDYRHENIVYSAAVDAANQDEQC